MTRSALLSGATLICLLMFLAQTPIRAQEPEILTNDTIRTLHKAGIAPSIIVNKIQASKCNFDISTDELLRLKADKIPDEIVNAMVQAMQPKAASEQPEASQVAGDPNDPASPHSPGIYWMSDNNELIKLKATTTTQTKGGGMFKTALTFGASKYKLKSILSGAHAALQIGTSRPIFYLYLDTKELVTEEASGVTPAEFVLCKVDVKEKDKRRELTYAHGSMWGAGTGATKKETVLFDYEELPGRVFKVTPKSDLVPGEYGFYYAGTTPISGFGGFGGMQGGKVFDFGITAEKPGEMNQ